MQVLNVSDVSVKEAASRLGVSERRVQALIEAARLPARRIGHSWVVPLSELPRVKYRSRPLSARMAYALVSSLSGEPSGLAGSDELRHWDRLNALLRDDDPAGLLRSWLASVAPPVRRFAVAVADLADLSADSRLVPAGISDPRSGIAAVDRFEGWVSARDLNAVVKDFLLVESSGANVWLHVGDEPPARPLPLGWLLADLAALGGPRESAAVRRLLSERKPGLAALEPGRRHLKKAGRPKASAQSAEAQALRARARADRQAAAASRALAVAKRAEARAKAALVAARKAEQAAAKAERAASTPSGAR